MGGQHVVGALRKVARSPVIAASVLGLAVRALLLVCGDQPLPPPIKGAKPLHMQAALRRLSYSVRGAHALALLGPTGLRYTSPGRSHPVALYAEAGTIGSLGDAFTGGALLTLGLSLRLDLSRMAPQWLTAICLLLAKFALAPLVRSPPSCTLIPLILHWLRLIAPWAGKNLTVVSYAALYS